MSYEPQAGKLFRKTYAGERKYLWGGGLIIALFHDHEYMTVGAVALIVIAVVALSINNNVKEDLEKMNDHSSRDE